MRRWALDKSGIHRYYLLFSFLPDALAGSVYIASEERVEFWIQFHECGRRGGHSVLSYFYVVIAGQEVAPTYEWIWVSDTDVNLGGKSVCPFSFQKIGYPPGNQASKELNTMKRLFASACDFPKSVQTKINVLWNLRAWWITLWEK